MPARSKAWQATKSYPHASRPRTGASVGASMHFPNEVPDGYRSPAVRAKDGGPVVKSPGRSPTASPDTKVEYPRAASPHSLSGYFYVSSRCCLFYLRHAIFYGIHASLTSCSSFVFINT